MICYVHPELVTALMGIFTPKPVKNNPSEKKKLKMAKIYRDHDAEICLEKIPQRNDA